MTVRVFTCASCGHRLRLGARQCGDCYQSTPMINRTATLLGSAVVLAAFVAAGVISLT